VVVELRFGGAKMGSLSSWSSWGGWPFVFLAGSMFFLVRRCVFASVVVCGTERCRRRHILQVALTVLLCRAAFTLTARRDWRPMCAAGTGAT
jgi:hypothetical protein